MAQVDDFGTHALQDAAHDVDGRIVAVKKAGSGDKTHLVGGTVFGQGFEFGGQIGHEGLRWRAILLALTLT
jgi:hypothetical protein